MKVSWLVMLGWILSISLVEACVGCRTPGESLGDPTKTVQAGLAFSWSVLFMLGAVATGVGLLVGVIVRGCRQATRE
jgi:hypothetical protein